jgi:DNA-binding transcriptional ArsR family regulator
MPVRCWAGAATTRLVADVGQGSKRELDDAKTMRALAHPVRLALLDTIRAEGEVTASRAAELLGDSPGNMSWHLQTLAKYGFVEEAGTGKGRSRPWRLVDSTISYDQGKPQDSETQAAGEALEGMLLNRAFGQFEEWRRRRDRFPEWSSESYLYNQIMYLTPADLKEFSDELGQLMGRFNDRRPLEDRPTDARPVKLFSLGHPLPVDDPPPT